MAQAGLEIRAKIDAEIFKTLIAIHGGGSIALLTFLQFLLREAHGNEYQALAYGVLWGLVSYQIGIIFALGTLGLQENVPSSMTNAGCWVERCHTGFRVSGSTNPGSAIAATCVWGYRYSPLSWLGSLSFTVATKH